MKKTVTITIAVIAILALMLLCSCGQEKSEYYSGVNDLSGKSIATWPGSVFESTLTKEHPEIKQVCLGEISVMTEALLSEKVDAFAYDTCFQSQADQEKLPITHIKDYAVSLEYGFMFADNEKGNKLRDEFNAFFREYNEKGGVAKLQNEWLKSGDMKAIDEALNSWPCGNGEINAVTSAQGAPFSYVYNNSISGYETALLYEFAKTHSYKLNLELVNFDATLVNIQSGKSDIAFQCVEKTPERMKEINFSDSTYVGDALIYVLRDPDTEPEYTSFDELNGKPIGCKAGGIEDQYLPEILPDSKRLYFNTNNELVEALKNGRIEAFFHDGLGVPDLINSVDGVTYFDQALCDQHIGAMFRKDDPEIAEFREAFNEFIAESLESGYADKIKNKWMEEAGDGEMEKFTFTGDKTLRIALTADAVPYNFLKNNEPVGFEVELLYKFCSEYGYTPQPVIVSFDGVIPAVSSGKVDVGMGVFCITEERAKSVDFSVSYLEDTMLPVVCMKGGSKSGGFASIKESFVKTFITEQRWKMILSGVLVTVEITVLSALFGSLIGFAVYLLCRRGNRLANGIFDALSRLLSGLPMVVVLMILYYILFAKSSMSGSLVSMIGFSASVAMSVYSSLKTSVKAIDRGQTEGAYSLGFTDLQTFLHIILPQAMEQFMPNYKATIIALINGTAVVGYIAVQDLTKMSDLIRARTYDAFFPLISTAIIYFVLGLLLTGLVRKLEIKVDPKRRSKEDILKRFNK